MSNKREVDTETLAIDFDEHFDGILKLYQTGLDLFSMAFLDFGVGFQNHSCIMLTNLLYDFRP